MAKKQPLSSKILVTNRAALVAKYGTSDVNAVKQAVDDLIAADRQRGLNTRLIYSKSERRHQAFLVTAEGERLRLRRYDGPSMRDAVLEAMEGQEVVVDGMLAQGGAQGHSIPGSRGEFTRIPSPRN